MREILVKLKDLNIGEKRELLKDAFVQLEAVTDAFGRQVHLLLVSNGRLSFSIVPERGMDAGEIWLDGEKISWERSKKRLLHPDSVDLYAKEAWESGFFAAIASLGPEVFGTPDEIRTVHGTGAFSMADMNSVCVSCDEETIYVTGTVPIKGYEKTPVYEKKVVWQTNYNSPVLLRKDTTKNRTALRQPIDDGYHIQAAGQYMAEGGNYVLPVRNERMLLRDAAPMENNPKEIYDFATEAAIIRCYQYIPEEVTGLDEETLFLEYKSHMETLGSMTAEMVVNKAKDKACVIARPLSAFPRSLLAKRPGEEAMYALEPCKTRPNSIKQKEIDGELQYLEAGESKESWLLFGVLTDSKEIDRIKKRIEHAAR